MRQLPIFPGRLPLLPPGLPRFPSSSAQPRQPEQRGGAFGAGVRGHSAGAGAPPRPLPAPRSRRHLRGWPGSEPAQRTLGSVAGASGITRVQPSRVHKAVFVSITSLILTTTS